MAKNYSAVDKLPSFDYLASMATITVIPDDSPPAPHRIVSTIHPRWLQTAERRYELWAMMERLAELESDER